MAIEAPAGTEHSGLIARLSRTRTATRAVIVFERLWPLVLPLVLVASLFVSLSWFGVFRFMPDWPRLALAGLLGLGVLAALYPLRLFRLPSAGEVDRRIERANRLEHQPVQTQGDRIVSVADPFSAALWREHQKRMAEKLGRLEGDLPRTGVPERDPYGLRAVAALLFVTAFAFSAGPLGGRLGDAFHPHARAAAVPPRIDAWVTPPAYTGKPPVFMTSEANAAQRAFNVPAGSDVTLRVTGGSGEETLSYTSGADVVAIEAKEAAVAAAASPARTGGRQFAAKLLRDGVLSLKSGETELSAWSFAVTPDRAPRIAFAGEPKRAVNGTLELNYTIEDDYGAASAQAVIEPAEKPAAGARPLYGAPEMPLSLPRRGTSPATGKTSRDLTEHPYAGLPSRLTLKATDDSGQEALSETKSLKLPERPFSNPLARAVIEQRQILALDANKKPRVLDLMDAVTLRPEDTFDNMSHYLAIMSARTRLKLARSDEQLREVVGYLWEIALGIEDGDLSAAEKRLRQAQEALKNALENGASDEEIEKLMAELRQAMQDYLREFAERAQRNPNMADMQQNGQELRQSDLDKLLDQIEELAKSGARDKAQELLSQLQEMMNNLQSAQRRQPGQNGQQSEMRQQMDKLGEIMRRQQEMMNETHRLDQMQRGQRQRGQDRGEQRGEQPGEGEQGQNGQPMTPEEFEEAMKQLQQGQGQLQGDLGDLMKGLEGMGIQPGEGFGEAGEAMGEAGEALGEGQGQAAVGEQGRALEALRRGAQDMMQQMQQAMQGDQGGGDEGGRQQHSDRDPLGRPRATTGPDFGNSVKVPDEIDVQRARQILDAIRKRLGNALSPELEKDYLERLLDLK